jgi:hypothetical protein
MATAPNFGAASVPALNPITAQIPNFAVQQMQAQRQQAIAQALMQQGMAPIDYDPHGRISWTQGLAKMLAAYQGTKLGNESINQQAALQQQGMQAMGQAYGMGAPQGDPQVLAAALSPQVAAQQAMSQGAQQGSVGPTTANAARMDAMQPAPAAPAAAAPGMGGVKTPLNPYGAPAFLAWQAGQGDPSAMEAYKTFLANQTSTPEMKNSAYMGQTPAQMLANTQGKALKEAQIEYKPGEFTFNPVSGQGGYFPSLPANTQPNGPVGPNGHVGGVSLIPGAPQALQTTSQAGASGTTAGSVHTVTNPDGSTSTGLGADLFKVPPAVQAGRDSDRLSILQQERAKPGNSAEDNAALDREISRAGGTRTVTGPDPTVQAGRTDQQTDMGKRWASLSGQAGNAQKVNSYLDNIGSLADRAATGQFADRLQLTNSLLAPFSQRATDATTASNLLDKYSNQIVAQLGSGGGMSTDAARDILHSAYPNRSMNVPAIHEAVNALKAQSVMAQAKARILQPAYTSNDPVSYTRAETAFDQAADPRIFQWRAIADPAARRAFGAKIMAQDPSLAAKAKALEAMGVQ